VAVAVAVFLVVVARHLIIHALHVVDLSAVATAFVLLIPELVARLAEDPGFTAKVFVRRSAVIGTLLGATLSFAVLIAVVYRPWQNDGFSLLLASQFVVQGIIVGAAIRLLFVRYLEKAIEGVSTEAVEVTLLVTVAGYLWLFPASERHAVLAAPYLVGIAMGFVGHFVLRGVAQNAAGAMRRRLIVLALLGGPNGPSLREPELRALDYYVNEEWRPLQDLIKRTHGVLLTTPLVIIKTAMECSHGEYEKALTSVNNALQNGNPVDELAPYLQLQKALCLSDLGTDPDEMFRVLREARPKSPRCVLRKCVWALRTAELVPLDRTPTPVERRRLKRAYVEMRQALRLAEVDELTVWSAAIGQAVPVTWTFLLDAFAYTALRNGDHHLSRALLLHCTRVDSKFASPYLHLGEWNLVQMARSNAHDERMMSRRRARTCLSIAIELEGKRDSLVKRRAQMLLDSTAAKPSEAGA
jgi:hypothetical protein